MSTWYSGNGSPTPQSSYDMHYYLHYFNYLEQPKKNLYDQAIKGTVSLF